MKKVILAAVVAASFAAPQAFAQAKNFEGFSVLGGLNIATSKYDAAARDGSSSLALSSTSTNGLLEAQYAAALGERFVLAAGVNVGLGDLNYGKDSKGDVKGKNNTSVFVKPGFATSDSVLVYGKVASLSSSFEYVGGSSSLSGIGYGAGVQVNSGKNVYYQAEFMQNNYDNKENATFTNKFSGSAVSFGIGYKF